MTIESYGKVNNIGHADIRELLNNEVVIEEKVDGSQISFYKDPASDYLFIKSRKQLIDQDNPGMFKEAVEYIQSIKESLNVGWVYRGEYLQKPRHNVLTYDRVPKNHIVLFDVETIAGTHLDPEKKQKEAEELGLECVPVLAKGHVESLEFLNELLERKSYLGGPNIEGVVLKAYGKLSRGGNLLKGKLVSAGFKEVQKKPKTGKPHRDIIEVLSGLYRSEVRWEKALQHMKEEGKIVGSMRDVGELMKEVHSDVAAECADEIKEELFNWAWPEIRKHIASGLPQWYKEKMAGEAFDE